MNTNTATEPDFTQEDMYNLILGSWEKQLDQLQENESQFREYIDIFLKATGYSEKTPLTLVFKGYLMGFNAGMEIADYLLKQ